MILLVLKDFWPLWALMYYIAGLLIAIWKLTSLPLGYQNVKRIDWIFFPVFAVALWLWPQLLVAGYLGKAAEPTGRASGPVAYRRRCA